MLQPEARWTDERHVNIGSATTGSAILNSLALLAHNSVGRATLRANPDQIKKVEPGKRQTVDQVQLSSEALKRAGHDSQGERAEQADHATRTAGQHHQGESSTSGEPLSADEEQHVRDLEQRDREVRTHEQAHKAAGGQFAGAINLNTTNGPNGQAYATGGSVPINVSPVSNDPVATIAKMQQVRRAALAPAQPSSADRRVAAQAQQQEAKARAEQASPPEETDGNEPAAKSSRSDAADTSGETRSESATHAPTDAAKNIQFNPSSGTYAVGSGAQRFESPSALNLVA